MTSYSIKRLNKEIEALDETKYVFLDSNDNNYYFLINIKNDYFNEIIVSLNFEDSCYPFRPPKKVLVNYYDYFEMLRPNPIIQDVINKLTGIRCLCCSTLLCKNNWNVMKNITDIFKEVESNLILKRRAIEYVLTKKVIDQKFGFYIPILEYI